MDVDYGKILTKEIIRLNGRIEALEKALREIDARATSRREFVIGTIARKALGEE